jgi:hypothetical protein
MIATIISWNQERTSKTLKDGHREDPSVIISGESAVSPGMLVE